MPTGEPTDERSEGRRVCLLTGAGGLLGNEFCRRFGTVYDIVAVCRRRAPAVPSQDEWFIDPLAPDGAVPANHGSVYTVYADLTHPADVERIIDIAAARYGQVDLLVNNAAYQGRYPNTMVDGTGAIDDLQHHLAMNVTAPQRLSLRVAQRLWIHEAADNRSRNRNVVNLSSTASTHVYPFLGQAGYAASKAALNTLTLHMAAEFEQFGIRVNALVPGSFPHEVPTERVADAIAALDQGSVSGELIPLVGDA